MRPVSLSQCKIPMTPIGNGNRGLPACNAVPQRTAPPRIPLYDLYTPNVIQVTRSSRMRWAGHVACTWERRGALVRKHEINRLLQRPGRGWKVNVKMEFREVGWGRGTGLAQDRDRLWAFLYKEANLWV